MAENVSSPQPSAIAALFRPAYPVVIPLQGGGKQITVTGRWPVTQAQWAHFMAVLEAMKPGLVKEGDGDA
jgi:hypothetical protein